MSKQRINLTLRYCVTAWLAILCVLLLVGMLVCFGMAVYSEDLFWLKVGGVVGGVLVVGAIAFLIESPMVRCLMCGGAMLRPLRCVRHKEARALLGSTTVRSCLRLAEFPKSLDCPYCGGHYKFTNDGKVRSRREVSR